MYEKDEHNCGNITISKLFTLDANKSPPPSARIYALLRDSKDMHDNYIIPRQFLCTKRPVLVQDTKGGRFRPLRTFQDINDISPR